MVASKNDLPEEQQGYNFIEAAKATNLPFLVFTSVSDATTTCGVHHFETKARIEIALRESGIPHAIIAPSALYDNFTRRHSWANFGALGVFETGLQGGKVQMTAADDVGARIFQGEFAPIDLADPSLRVQIGEIAAQMLLKSGTYAGRRIDLAGDYLSMSEVQRAYSAVEGKPVRKAAVPAMALKLLPQDAQQMFRWFRTDGFTVDIDALRKEFPRLRSFEQWLREGKVAA